MTEYSEPYYEATKYTVYPTGAKQFTPDQIRGFCIYVEQSPDTGMWRVHDGFAGGMALTKSGNWVWPSNLANPQRTRFENLTDALLAAKEAVDKREKRMSLVTMMKRLNHA